MKKKSVMHLATEFACVTWFVLMLVNCTYFNRGYMACKSFWNPCKQKVPSQNTFFN